jgi:hypothetical protein
MDNNRELSALTLPHSMDQRNQQKLLFESNLPSSRSNFEGTRYLFVFFTTHNKSLVQPADVLLPEPGTIRQSPNDTTPGLSPNLTADVINDLAF